jgi:AraC-like DNA-binding protein
LPQLARQLCASIFRDGAQIEHVRAHRIAGRFTVEPHAHDDLVQFDWCIACRGTIVVGDASHAIDGCSFQLVGPSVSHAMTVDAAAGGGSTAGGGESRVYHVRIRLPREERRAFAGVGHVATRLPVHPSLEVALRDAWRLTVGAPAGRPGLLAVAKLAEAIAMWPGAADASDSSNPAQPAASRTSVLDRDLDAALQLMDQRLVGPPPTLPELAAASHLSVRHFSRRFRDAFQLAPIDYLDRKRLHLAQQMLAHESCTVGEVADRLGFSSLATFSRWFSNLAHESPTDYRARPHAM